MKKLITLLMTAAMLAAGFSCVTFPTQAAADGTAQEIIVSQTTEYFEDGSSVTIIVTEEPSVPARSAEYTKSGSKHYVFTDEDDNELWRFTVNGTFTVKPGVSAYCTKDSYDYDITDKSWHRQAAISYSLGNQAMGEGIFVQKFLTLITYKQEFKVTLSCDSDGNLS